MRVASISSKQQITLSKDELSALGLGKGAKVLVLKKEGVLSIKPISVSIVEQVAGSLTKYVDKSKLGKPFSEILEVTKKRAAAHLAKK